MMKMSVLKDKLTLRKSVINFLLLLENIIAWSVSGKETSGEPAKWLSTMTDISLLMMRRSKKREEKEPFGLTLRILPSTSRENHNMLMKKLMITSEHTNLQTKLKLLNNKMEIPKCWPNSKKPEILVTRKHEYAILFKWNNTNEYYIYLRYFNRIFLF